VIELANEARKVLGATMGVPKEKKLPAAPHIMLFYPYKFDHAKKH